jgi:two-component sensor histidine kinase
MKPLLFILIFFLNLNALSIDFSKNSEKILLNSAIYIDKENLSFNEIQSQVNFLKSDTQHLNLGFVQKTNLWIRLDFYNPQKRKITKILEIRNPLLESITLYSSREIAKKGMLYADKQHKNINRFFEISLESQEFKTFYLKVENSTTALRLGVFLKDKISFLEDDHYKQMIIAIFFSIIIILFIYNLLLFGYTKESAYLFYCFYLLTLIFQQATYLGVSQIFLPQGLTYYDNLSVVFKVNIMYIAAAMFAKSFLQTRLFPHIDKIYNTIILLAIIEVPLFGTPWFYYPEIAILTGFIFVLFNIIASIYIYLQGYKQARFFVIGWSFLVVGFIIMIFDGLGVITVMHKVSNLIIFLTTLEAIILSLAFTDRYMILKLQKKETDKVLIDTLQERQTVIESEIKRQTKDLQTVLENKKVLLKELHHRTKNNLQLILSLVRMQSDSSNELMKKSYQNLESRINAISKTHEMLYINDDLEKINMDEYLNKLCHDIDNSSDREIDINLKIYDIEMPLQEASYIGLVVNELITNSIKYVDKEKIVVSVEMYLEESRYILNIKDNGNGFEYKDLDLESLGMGIKLVNTLIKNQLNGKIESNNSNGFEYKIEFIL